MTKMLLCNDCTYQGEDLANLFNDKFVAVGSTLPPLNWCPLPVDVYPPKFIISIEETETALLSSKLYSALVPMKYQRGFFARTHLFCVVHYAPFSICPSVKASFLPCGSQPTFYQFQNLLPPSTSIQTFVSIVKHVKLLGVIVSNDLKWNLHVNAICKKASKRLYALLRLRRNALPPSVLVKVYCTCVTPILEYA